jgi:hypothetical protein
MFFFLIADSSASTDKPSQASSPPQNSNTICQTLGTFNVADNTNCASYFMCNNGKETKMNCQDKQLFNPDTSQCEDFQQVFCGTRPVNLADKNHCKFHRLFKHYYSN